MKSKTLIIIIQEVASKAHSPLTANNRKIDCVRGNITKKETKHPDGKRRFN